MQLAGDRISEDSTGNNAGCIVDVASVVNAFCMLFSQLSSFIFCIPFLPGSPFRVVNPAGCSFLPKSPFRVFNLASLFIFMHFHSVFSFLSLTTYYPGGEPACNIYWNRHSHTLAHACSI
ncbi:transmembrane protein, putative [Medicago truncatula]|uniref:Transmembrane protein, putative n=1 Tax=Medicago truncatula TaxID=3880 RepID=G7L449_MEDTR|nr:transmembrane protein, putative [Medicago truncatula]